MNILKRFLIIRLLGAILIICASFLIFSQQALAFGIGMSPGVVKDTVNGVRVERKIYMTRMEKDSDSEAYYAPSVSKEGARYIELPEKIIKFEKGETIKYFSFYIYPQGAANGEYEAQLKLSRISDPVEFKMNGQSGASLSVGVVVSIRFTVTDKEVLKYTLKNFVFNSTEVNSPLRISYYIENQGNVNFIPDKVEVELSDITDKTNFAKIVFDKQEVPIALASHSQILDLIKEHGLSKGRYLATTTFWFRGEKVFEKAGDIIDIYAEGTLAQSAVFDKFDISKIEFEPNELVKFSGTITNKGDVALRSIFYVEIIKSDISLDLLRSDQKMVGKAKSGEFNLTYRPAENGEYLAKAYFEYGVNQTKTMEKKFQVGKPDVVKKGIVSKNLLIYIGVGVVITILIVFMIILYIKLKKAKKDRYDNTQN
ncbi:MAG: hypothetical protein ABIH87_04480 [bacterium]